MRAGRLRHKLTIQTATRTQDGYGDPIQTWSTFASVWGSWEPLSGSELNIAQEQNSETSVRIIIRYLSGVTPKMRVALGSQTAEIVSVANKDGRNIEMELMGKVVE